MHGDFTVESGRAWIPERDVESPTLLVTEIDEVGVCLDADRICRQVDGVVFTLAGRLCILHELGHLWLSQQVFESVREELIDHTGAPSWRDPGLAWSERGVEQAADTLAWGLLGETIEILGRPLPPCDQLHEGFLILTGTAPLSECDRFASES